MKRRTFFAVAAVALVGARTAIGAASPEVNVYKESTCGCCGNWVKHLRADGFTVKVNEVPDADVYRARSGVPVALASCHTAFVGGYVIVGHVPAEDIRRLLATRPDILGLTVPGMPPESPGMAAPHGPGYKVLSIDAKGFTRVFRSYPVV